MGIDPLFPIELWEKKKIICGGSQMIPPKFFYPKRSAGLLQRVAVSASRKSEVTFTITPHIKPTICFLKRRFTLAVLVPP